MTNRKPFLQRWKPAVSARILVLTAGATWLGVGILLDTFAGRWLLAESGEVALVVFGIGMCCALVIHHFGFLRLADRNLQRILPMEDRRCFFSFVPWKNYFLVLCMIFLGHLLRHSPLPKAFLGALYISIGTALILSSFRYFRFFLKMSAD